MNNRVNLTKRVVVSGKDRYCPVVFSANGRVKPGYVAVDGEPQFHAGGNYYLDWTENGKRRRQSVGPDAAQANARMLRKQAELNALAQGIAVVPDADADGAGKHSIALAVEEFLSEVKLTKKDKTWRAYQVALSYFQQSCPKRFIEDIQRIDLLKFSSFLKNDKQQSPRSVHNKFACLLTFLSVNGVPKLVGKNDRPRFVKEQVEIYEDGELEALYTVCSPYHRTLYAFLLMTGLREKEAMYCTWDDVNLKASTVNMRWKRQYDFAPKAYREREVVPIPTKLVKLLTAFKPKDAKGSDLIFHTASGLPDTHMLRALKRNAARAGLNRDRFGIHKFRATFATMHLQAGADLRSVQAWLGHTNLESTIRYLKPARTEAMLDKVNATFA